MKRALLIGLMLAVAASPLAAKKKEKVASFRATAVQQDIGGAAIFVIDVREWNTPDQRQALVQGQLRELEQQEILTAGRM